MIELKEVCKAYGNQSIIDHVSIRFPKTGLVCITGPSGSGKSTLLNMLAGFDQDYQGDIVFQSTRLKDLSDAALCAYRNQSIGFVFQDYHLLTGYTVLENVQLACSPFQHTIKNDLEKAEKLLKDMDMSHKLQENVENLSGGQKQRVAIARALMNHPPLLLVDEPTAALDHESAKQIMNILKTISHDCLVIVITHSAEICKYADEEMKLEDGKLLGNSSIDITTVNHDFKAHALNKSFIRKQALKNFHIHKKRFLVVAFVIAFGVCSLLASLSFHSIMNHAIAQFQEKNNAFNNGYIRLDKKNNAYEFLSKHKKVENVYYQYKIENITLSLGDKSETLAEKYPIEKATQSLSFGSLPNIYKNEIALSPSLARKFATNIQSLLGKTMKVTYQGKTYNVKICGIYNAGYDDFYVSSDMEQQLYKGNTKQNAYSLSYDVTKFENVVAVHKALKDKGIKSIDRAKEIDNLLGTFQNINAIFLTITFLILGIGIFISTLLLVKLQNSRYKEVGLYAAIGLQKRSIRFLILLENIVLAMVACAFTLVMQILLYIVNMLLNLGITLSASQSIMAVIGATGIVVCISMLGSYKLIHTKPTIALKK